MLGSWERVNSFYGNQGEFGVCRPEQLVPSPSRALLCFSAVWADMVGQDMDMAALLGKASVPLPELARPGWLVPPHLVITNCVTWFP